MAKGHEAKWRLHAVARKPLPALTLALALGTATKYLVHVQEMAADKSILPIAYGKRAGRILKHISKSSLRLNVKTNTNS